MPDYFRQLNAIQLILALRAVSIAIQLVLILFVNLILGYVLPLTTLLLIVFKEILFNFGSWVYHQKKSEIKAKYLFIQLIADVLFLGILLYFSGGATNAFVSLLLIPIAIAAVSLPLAGILILTMAAISIYSVLLWSQPMHIMHGNMEGHFIGMWVNFLFSSAVVAFVVTHMAKANRLKQQVINKYREQQLKQERIVALSVASAQVTHDIATPIATLRLLIDELAESLSDRANPDTSSIGITNIDSELALLTEFDTQLTRCQEKLAEFRTNTEQIKHNQLLAKNCDALFEQIVRHCQLYYPEINFEFSTTKVNCLVEADSSLIPAILNIINNAVTASEKASCKQVNLVSEKIADEWHITIRDFGAGFQPASFAELGNDMVISEQGFGMALMLSNASLERNHGRIMLNNINDALATSPQSANGAAVTICLPCLPDAMASGKC
ncbi:sensor histidine kinase [Colwellia sp. MEBiC06753]